MTVNRRRYPPRSIWAVKRQEALERVSYRCELCGLPDATEFFNERKPHPFHEAGTPYRMYLQLAHKQQYETWNREADTLYSVHPATANSMRGLNAKRRETVRAGWAGDVMGLVQRGKVSRGSGSCV